MDVQDYLVTLGIRPAELSGLKELPGTTKDRLTPLVLLAPWLATTPLSRALDKFEEAYPSRPYFTDVDTYYRMNDKPNEAKELWAQLAAKPADLDAWWQLLAQYPNANPSLLMAERTIESAREQIEWARDNNRTFCLRMNLAEGNATGIEMDLGPNLTIVGEGSATSPTRENPGGEIRGTVGLEMRCGHCHMEEMAGTSEHGSASERSSARRLRDRVANEITKSLAETGSANDELMQVYLWLDLVAAEK